MNKIKTHYFSILISLICIFSCSLLKAEVKNLAIEEKILGEFASLVEASKNLNIEKYLEHLDSDKFVGLNSDGTNWNSIDDFLPLIKASFNSVEKVIELEFTNVNISIVDNNTAILVNEFYQQVKLKNDTIVSFSGGGTQVWSKRSGEWKLVSISASSKPQ